MHRNAIFALAIGVALSAATLASAQTTISTPNVNQQMFPNGSGKERGLQDLNNSGQVGTITLHKRDAGSTEVVLNVKDTVAGRNELAGILRYPASNCATYPKDAPMTLALSPVVNGHSSTVVPRAIEDLLSGNYLVLVYSSDKTTHAFSCGRLYK